jgi:hypothetical protein
MSSLLEPDPSSLGFFNLATRFGHVDSVISLETRRLDDIALIGQIDFLKMDIQGAELMVLQHGRHKLKQAIAVQTEVSFITLYQDQPAMGEIDGELRRQGFIPHCYADIKKWPISPVVVNNNPRAALNQLLEADVVYVRDITKPDAMSNEQLKHLALVAHYCYHSLDLAGRCLKLLINRGALPADSLETYMRSISHTHLSATSTGIAAGHDPMR